MLEIICGVGEKWGVGYTVESTQVYIGEIVEITFRLNYIFIQCNDGHSLPHVDQNSIKSSKPNIIAKRKFHFL